jgi:hypothetical protein
MYGLATCIKEGWMLGRPGSSIAPPRGDLPLMLYDIIESGISMLPIAISIRVPRMLPDEDEYQVIELIL